jgi:hypothetical protein
MTSGKTKEKMKVSSLYRYKIQNTERMNPSIRGELMGRQTTEKALSP